MKINNYTFIVVALVLFTSCNAYVRTEKRDPVVAYIKSANLEESSDAKVKVALEINLPKRYVTRKSQVVFAPRISYLDDRLDLKSVSFNGPTFDNIEQKRIKKLGLAPKKNNVNTVAKPRSKALTYHYEDEVEYQPWMEKSSLVASLAQNFVGFTHSLGSMVLANGIKPYVKPVVNEKLLKIVKSEEMVTHLYYPLDRAAIVPCLRDNESQLNDMVSLISKIVLDTSIVVQKIVISATCSPEGPYHLNDTLARSRAASLQDYLLSRVAIPDNIVELQHTAEDWDDLLQYIKKSNVLDKDAMVKVIESVPDYDKRNELLAKMQGYRELYVNYYPLLRKAVCEIFYIKSEYKVEADE